MSRIIVYPDHFAPRHNCTPPIMRGGMAACRVYGDQVPSLLDEDGIPTPFECTEYATLAAAMAAYPDLPWYDLGVFGGEDAEPELIAAQEAAREVS